MIDPDSLSHAEVLSHLQQLGYRNITLPQLNEFMKDLKKLIIYDQKCNKIAHSASEDGESSCSHEIESSPNDSTRTNDSGLCSDCQCATSDSSCISSVLSLNDNCVGKRPKYENIKPHSSFIRPWQLQPQCKVPITGKNLKSDPVQLYQKYKQIWVHNKVPGEKSHSQLRWVIREKMLGQDPHPRPVSQASSSDKRSRTVCSK